MRVPALALIGLLAAAGGLQAQTESRLAGRLAPDARAAVLRLVDSVRTAGLPTEPLVDKALEGASKRAPTDRIVQAVRMLASNLGQARQALGTGVGEPELVAGARAIRAGASPSDLSALHRRRGNRLLVPLATLTELVATGVPADSAAAAVLALADRGAPDRDFTAMQRDVAEDIQAGAPPEAAASVRAHGGPPDAVPGRKEGRDHSPAPRPPETHGKPPSGHGQPPGPPGQQPPGRGNPSNPPGQGGNPGNPHPGNPNPGNPHPGGNGQGGGRPHP